jgi:aminoglycoside phosphotransferase (APT) family kinase protein
MPTLEVDHRAAARARHLQPPSLWEFVEESALRPVVVGVSKDHNAKVSVLLVSPETGRSELVVKVPTSRAAGLAVERERHTLDAVRQLLPEPLRATLPQPVQMVDVDGRMAMVATAIPGTPMTVSYLARRHTANARQVAADLGAAGGWLADLQQATAAAAAPIALAAGLRAPLRRRYPDEPGQGELFDRLAELDARLSTEGTPRTVVHGDFWFGNVLLSERRLSGVVDWEAATTSGEPVSDLARFALSYALYLDRRTRRGRPVAGHPGLRADRWGAAGEVARDGRGWFPELFRGFLEDGLRRLDAPGALWRDVALAGIAELAARSDDDTFARRHLDLFRRLAARRSRGGGA